MTDTVPLPVVRYLAATTPEEISDCFAQDGVAMDERQTHTGREAILAWRRQVAAVPYRQEILSAQHEGDRATVTCRISGSFPGSPVKLDYRFELAGDLIARLEIR